jgi:hypothetical protein
MNHIWGYQPAYGWSCQGFVLSMEVTHTHTEDPFEYPYHAEVADAEGELVGSLSFRSLIGAKAWAESEDFYAAARDLADQSAEAEWTSLSLEG